VKLRPIPMT